MERLVSLAMEEEGCSPRHCWVPGAKGQEGLGDTEAPHLPQMPMFSVGHFMEGRPQTVSSYSLGEQCRSSPGCRSPRNQVFKEAAKTTNLPAGQAGMGKETGIVKITPAPAPGLSTVLFP